MPPIDPRLVKARRFPVHAAVVLCVEQEVRRLVDEDANFHLCRKMPDIEISVVHAACSFRRGDPADMQRILDYLIKKGAPINDLDAAGQPPLLYAVCNASPLSSRLCSSLLRAGCDVNFARKSDLFTALHLAVSFEDLSCIRVLISHDADQEMRSGEGKTALEMLEQRSNKEQLNYHRIKDVLKNEHRAMAPAQSSLPPEHFGSLLSNSKETKEDVSICVIEEMHVIWRDCKGNNCLHVAAWKGDVDFVRLMLENGTRRDRNALINALNDDNLTPIVLAILNMQDAVVEELLTNKNSRKLIKLDTSLMSTKENVVHLFLRYCYPSLSIRSLFRRAKELNDSDSINARDKEGNLPWLRRDRPIDLALIHQILNCKQAQNLIDLSQRDRFNNTLLHLAVLHDDVSLLRKLLPLLPNSAVANMLNASNETCLQLMMRMQRFHMAAMVLSSPMNKLFSRHSTFMKEIIEHDQERLWNLLESSLDLNKRDDLGDTYLMHAIKKGHVDLVGKAVNKWREKIDVNILDNDNNNLFMVAINNGQEELASYVLDKIQGFHEKLNKAVNKQGELALVMAVNQGMWRLVDKLLSLRERNELDVDKNNEGNNSVMESSQLIPDIMIKDGKGNSLLCLLLLARLKFLKLEETSRMKSDLDNAANSRHDADRIFQLALRVLKMRKRIYGPTLIKGRDKGVEELRRELENNKQLRSSSPLITEVIQAFSNLYQSQNVTQKRKKNPRPASMMVLSPSENENTTPKWMQELKKRRDSNKRNSIHELAEAKFVNGLVNGHDNVDENEAKEKEINKDNEDKKEKKEDEFEDKRLKEDKMSKEIDKEKEAKIAKENSTEAKDKKEEVKIVKENNDLPKSGGAVSAIELLIAKATKRLEEQKRRLSMQFDQNEMIKEEIPPKDNGEDKKDTFNSDDGDKKSNKSEATPEKQLLEAENTVKRVSTTLSRIKEQNLKKDKEKEDKKVNKGANKGEEEKIRKEDQGKKDKGDEVTSKKGEEEEMKGEETKEENNKEELQNKEKDMKAAVKAENEEKIEKTEKLEQPKEPKLMSKDEKEEEKIKKPKKKSIIKTVKTIKKRKEGDKKSNDNTNINEDINKNNNLADNNNENGKEKKTKLAITKEEEKTSEEAKMERAKRKKVNKDNDNKYELTNEGNENVIVALRKASVTNPEENLEPLKPHLLRPPSVFRRRSKSSDSFLVDKKDFGKAPKEANMATQTLVKTCVCVGTQTD